MKCPNCNVSLVMTDRSGIEIDYCPDCRGVWLDRGELDKIIERATPENPAPPQQQFQQQQHQQTYSDRRDYSRNDDYRYKKKKGLLGELFDF